MGEILAGQGGLKCVHIFVNNEPSGRYAGCQKKPAITAISPQGHEVHVAAPTQRGLDVVIRRDRRTHRQ
jgi:hypothetical protein